MLRVRLAGGLGLELDGDQIAPPRSRRGRALLAWLALNPGMHPRGALAARFWPDVLDTSARTSLRAALTELRAALGAGAEHLVATREAVGLGGDGLWVDVREFERLLGEGRLDEAMDACAGELLTDMDDDWVHDARAGYAERMGTALERLAGAAEAAGDHAEAVRRSRSAVALDPVAEEPSRALIRRLAAGGDRAAALAAYEQLADRLRTALGIAPSAPTRELLAQIRDGAAAETPAVAPPPAVLDAAQRLFVGRDGELARLRESWWSVRMHFPRRLLLLAGEPGIGKTRIALQFANEALADGAVVVLGRCSEEPLRPYEPFAELLGDQLLAGVDEGDDPGARYRFFESVDAGLADLAGERPTLVLLEDLHWADRPTLLLLAFLLRSQRPAPMLVLGTYRTTELGRRTPLTGALAELQRDGVLERVPLGPLGAEEVSRLAEAWLGSETGARISATVHSRTAGNAFFVEEVLRGLAEGGGEEAIPESVRHAVSVRLAHLGDEAEGLLGVAAVLGLEVDLGVLQAVTGVDDLVAEAGLDELVAAHLVRPAPGSARAVEFPHALVRETVYEELNALRRARLHRRAADVLIARSEERHVEAIAHHLFEAAEADRAVAYLVRAAEQASAMLAYEEAAAFYGRALEAGGEDGPLLLARGNALLHAGEPAAADECFLSAVAIARRSGDAILLARAALGHCGLAVSIIDVDPAKVVLLEEALEAVGDSDPALASQLLARLAIELYYAPSRDRSEAPSAQAVATARAAGDPGTLAAALNSRHVALWRPDGLDERREVAQDMIEAARRAGDRLAELQGRNWLVVDLWELGDVAAWRDEVARHGRLADELRIPGYAWYSPLWAAVDALHGGRFGDVPALLETARAAGERAGERNAELFVAMLDFQERMMRGAYVEKDLAFAEEKIANSPAGMSYRSSYAWLLAERGELDDARAQLAIVSEDAFSALPFDANWLSAVGECAAAAAALGDSTVAAPIFEVLVPYAGRHLTAGRAIASYGAADRLLGGLAAVLGDHDRAIAYFEAGLERDGANGMRPWVVHGRFGLARALEARGDRDRAEAELAEVQTEARELGLTGLLP